MKTELKACIDFIRANVGYLPLSDEEQERLKGVLMALFGVDYTAADISLEIHTDSTEYIFEVAKSPGRRAYTMLGEQKGTINEIKWKSAPTILGTRGRHDLVEIAMIERDKFRQESLKEQGFAPGGTFSRKLK